MAEAPHWDERYASEHYIYGTAPNAYVVSQSYRLHAGSKVLAAADGEGRNGVWLAARGFDVTSLDQSSVGLDKGAALARARGVAPRFVCADLASGPLPGAPYDAIVAIFAHFPPETRATIHRAFVGALRPGGLLILEAFHPRQIGRPSGGPRTADMMYDAELLRHDFADLEILELLEGTATFDEGPKHQGEGWVVRLVARKRGPVSG
jgi:hypothetical protein